MKSLFTMMCNTLSIQTDLKGGFSVFGFPFMGSGLVFLCPMFFGL